MTKRTIGLIVFLLTVCAGFAVLARPPRARNTPVVEKLFVSSVGGYLVIDVHNNALRERNAVSNKNGGFEIDGHQFSIDWDAVRTAKKKYAAENMLSTKDGKLLFKGLHVSLPNGLLVRDIWSAVYWKDWVICIGRTSARDYEAALEPPFFASELIAFNAKDRRASVRYLAPNPPSGDGEVLILTSH
ncbi:MAG: hypothetical protein SF187_11960 [Deltaproteobacteria bacterium]|nr:hypothetical protein [Deltaproteobacteria bacterium]